MFTHMFFKTLGLAPFNIKIDECNEKVTPTRISFVYSHTGCAYNIGLLILLFGSNFLTVPALFDMQFRNKPQLVKQIFISKLLAAIAVLTVVWIVQCLKQRRVIEVANRIISIDNLMAQLQQSYVIKSIKLKAIICFIINWLIWITLITLDVIVFPKSIGIISIPILVPSFVCSWFFMLFAFVFTILESRVCSINSALFKFLKVPLYQYELTESPIVTNQIRFKDLLIIKRAHESLYVATKDITGCYACLLLLVITSFCGNLIYTTYYFARLMFSPAKKLPDLITLDSVIYIIMELFPLIIMAASVTRLKRQIEMTPNVLYQIMHLPTNSHEMQLHLKQFSLELLHRRIEVSAYNFMPLDCSLLHSIAAMTTTYLVILLQMQ